MEDVDLEWKIISWCFKLIALLVFGSLIFMAYDVLSGNAQKRVEVRAEKFLNTLKISHDVVSCNASDSDGDGYITCSFNFDGKIKTIECSDSIFLNSTCRNMKINSLEQ